jgi:hypothetical protein
MPSSIRTRTGTLPMPRAVRSALLGPQQIPAPPAKNKMLTVRPSWSSRDHCLRIGRPVSGYKNPLNERSGGNPGSSNLQTTSIQRKTGERTVLAVMSNFLMIPSVVLVNQHGAGINCRFAVGNWRGGAAWVFASLTLPKTKATYSRSVYMHSVFYAVLKQHSRSDECRVGHIAPLILPSLR